MAQYAVYKEESDGDPHLGLYSDGSSNEIESMDTRDRH